MPKAKRKYPDKTGCVGNAALSALHLPPPPTPQRWAGRLSKLPQLKQFLPPLIEPHLAKLQTGEVQKCSVFVPKIGAFTLERKGEEILITFQDALSVAYQRLQMLRAYALAVRYKTIVKSKEGGHWFWLAQQRIFPPEFRFLNERAVLITTLQERAPPPWRNEPLPTPTHAADDCSFVGTRFVTPSSPRAIRAPTAALPAGVAGSR